MGSRVYACLVRTFSKKLSHDKMFSLLLMFCLQCNDERTLYFGATLITVKESISNLCTVLLIASVQQAT